MPMPIPAIYNSTSVDAALAAAEEANRASIGGTQEAERTLAIAGYAGREQRIIVGPVTYVLRLVFVGNRLFSISVKGSAAQVDEADASQFLNSFAATP